MALPLTGTAGSYSPVHAGAYDLSGALYDYAAVPGLIAATQPLGFGSWRLGLGRWEIGSEGFLSVPGAGGPMACPPPPFPMQMSTHANLDALLAERDYFQLTVDHGNNGVVDQADLDEPLNYHFQYLDAVLDQAQAFGVEPFLNIDIVPRVLASRAAPVVVTCDNTFRNGVSTGPPADNNVYAYTIIRVLQHVLEGWPNNTPPRALRYVELGNEPDFLDYFWGGTQAQFFAWYTTVASVLSQARALTPANSPWRTLQIGGGSFALAAGQAGSWIPAFLTHLDANPAAPLDFLTFHSYKDNGPVVLVDMFQTFAELKTNAVHAGRYLNTAMMLTEWGPDLSRLGDATFNLSMDAPLVHAYALAGAHALRFAMTHKTFFYNYLYSPALGPAFTYGSITHGVTRTPNAEVYDLFNQFYTATPRMVDTPATLPVGGALEGIAVAGLSTDGTVLQMVAVNTLPEPRTLSLTFSSGAGFAPTTLTATMLAGAPPALTVGPSLPINRASGVQHVLPPRSVMLLRMQ